RRPVGEADHLVVLVIADRAVLALLGVVIIEDFLQSLDLQRLEHAGALGDLQNDRRIGWNNRMNHETPLGKAATKETVRAASSLRLHFVAAPMSLSWASRTERSRNAIMDNIAMSVDAGCAKARIANPGRLAENADGR